MELVGYRIITVTSIFMLGFELSYILVKYGLMVKQIELNGKANVMVIHSTLGKLA